jgi:hypothetical protein
VLGRQVKTCGHTSNSGKTFDRGKIVDVDSRREIAGEIGREKAFLGRFSVRQGESECHAALRVKKFNHRRVAVQQAKAQHDRPPRRHHSDIPGRRQRELHSLSLGRLGWPRVDCVKKRAADLPLPFPYQGNQLADFVIAVVLVLGVPDEHRQHQLSLPVREFYRPSHA